MQCIKIIRYEWYTNLHWFRSNLSLGTRSHYGNEICDWRILICFQRQSPNHHNGVDCRRINSLLYRYSSLSSSEFLRTWKERRCISMCRNAGCIGDIKFFYRSKNFNHTYEIMSIRENDSYNSILALEFLVSKSCLVSVCPAISGSSRDSWRIIQEDLM